MSFSSPNLMPSFTRPPSRVAILSVSAYNADLEALLFEALRGV